MTTKKGQGRPGAPDGNTNRAIPEEERKQGRTAIMSLPYEEWEAFKAVCRYQSTGEPMTDQECVKEWRRVAHEAVLGYTKYHSKVQAHDAESEPWRNP